RPQLGAASHRGNEEERRLGWRTGRPVHEAMQDATVPPYDEVRAVHRFRHRPAPIASPPSLAEIDPAPCPGPGPDVPWRFVVRIAEPWVGTGFGNDALRSGRGSSRHRFAFSPDALFRLRSRESGPGSLRDARARALRLCVRRARDARTAARQGFQVAPGDARAGDVLPAGVGGARRGPDLRARDAREPGVPAFGARRNARDRL